MQWPLMVVLVLLTLFLPLPLGASQQQPTSQAATKVKINDEKLLNAIESNLITLFGLAKRPRPKREEVVVPTAMLDLYKRQTGLEVDTTNLPLPGKHTMSANTVRSFLHQESSVDDQFRKSHRFRLVFPVETIPKSEKLQAAELQLSRVSIQAPGAPLAPLHILVHDIVLPGIRGKREPVIRLVDSRRVWPHQDERLKLDVTPAVQRWLHNPSANHGLLVVVISSPSSESSTSPPTNHSAVLHNHVRLKRGAKEDRSAWKKVEPVLFTYTDDGKYKRSPSPASLANRSRRGVKKMKRRELCRRHELYVDFEDVGWRDWIVAPPGYDAYYCSGDCPFPLSDHFNTTNHAIVQTLVNSVFPNSAPKACCVPTTLAPISMLYLDEEGKVVLKNYQDMSVLGCGCR